MGGVSRRRNAVFSRAAGAPAEAGRIVTVQLDPPLRRPLRRVRPNRGASHHEKTRFSDSNRWFYHGATHIAGGKPRGFLVLSPSRRPPRAGRHPIPPVCARGSALPVQIHCIFPRGLACPEPERPKGRLDRQNTKDFTGRCRGGVKAQCFLGRARHREGSRERGRAGGT